MKTGIVKDWRYVEHNMGAGHPESPERIRAIYERLEKDKELDALTLIPTRPATEKEVAFIHTQEYIEQIKESAGRERVYLDPDTSTSARSWEVARLAAGGLLEAADWIMDGKVQGVFALVRPPGHHAEASRAMGFCLFNNVAIAAKSALKDFGLQRILIVDWDVHHGNGTQNSFYEDPHVLYVSTHRYGFFYPGSGAATEVGRGQGEGFTVNIPLPTGCTDSVYGILFDSILKPIALEFKPELVLVSAGFDTHQDDPLGGMEVTPEGYARMTQILMEIADATAQGKLVLALEGGYSISGQRDSVKAVLRELLQASPLEKQTLLEKEKADIPRVERAILQIKNIQKKYWKTL